jgi:hypothetical protein
MMFKTWLDKIKSIWVRRLDIAHPNVQAVERRHAFRRAFLPPAFRAPRDPTDEEVRQAILAVPAHWAADLLFGVSNSSQASTAAPIKQPTGNAIRTMTQLKAGAGQYLKIVEWGASFDASAAATPGQCELFETTVAATMSTAYVNADIMRYGSANGPAQGDTANLPIDVTSTSTSGFATAAVTEGTVANYRLFDLQMLPPTGPYVKQFPLGREPEVKAGNFLRSRMTFAATVNSYIYIIFSS